MHLYTHKFRVVFLRYPLFVLLAVFPQFSSAPLISFTLHPLLPVLSLLSPHLHTHTNLSFYGLHINIFLLPSHLVISPTLFFSCARKVSGPELVFELDVQASWNFLKLFTPENSFVVVKHKGNQHPFHSPSYKSFFGLDYYSFTETYFVSFSTTRLSLDSSFPYRIIPFAYVCFLVSCLLLFLLLSSFLTSSSSCFSSVLLLFSSVFIPVPYTFTLLQYYTQASQERPV